MLITNSALARLVMINTGCRTFVDKKEENLKYLFRCVLSGQDFDIVELEKKLPEKSYMYSSIYSFALSIGAEKINTDILYRFFGGKVHVEHVLDQIRAVNEGGKFSERYLFAHMLIPVALTAISEDNIAATYVNNDAAVDVSGLLVHPCIPVKFKVGDMVLVHYAVIIGVAEKNICDWLLEEQESSHEFMEVCRRISKIDYKSFWNIRGWTEDLIKKCF